MFLLRVLAIYTCKFFPWVYKYWISQVRANSKEEIG